MITEGSVLADRYEVSRLIAHGGVAAVFEALDRRLGRAVAVKAVRTADEADRARFADEVAILASLLHPGLVGLYDSGDHEGEPYIVLELLPGPTLTEVLRDEAPLPMDRVAALGAALASALAHAHDRGVVHRDVKPSNVIFDAHGDPRLADFGVARLLGAQRHTATATTIGTAAYMSPEQVEGGPITGRADVYSLGLVLLEGITGERAFPGPSHEAAVHRLTRDPQIPESLPGEWRDLLAAMTARQPEQRPSAADTAARLSALSTSPALAATRVLATRSGSTGLLPAHGAVRAAAPPEPAGAERDDRRPGPDRRAATADAGFSRRRPAAVAGVVTVGLVAILNTLIGPTDEPRVISLHTDVSPAGAEVADECDELADERDDLAAHLQRIDRDYLTADPAARPGLEELRGSLAADRAEADSRWKRLGC